MNRDFLLNCVDFLCDNESWMELRSRQVKLRMLNKSKIRSERLFWQIFNVAVPLVVLLVFGLGWFLFRKHKYTKM